MSFSLKCIAMAGDCNHYEKHLWRIWSYQPDWNVSDESTQPESDGEPCKPDEELSDYSSCQDRESVYSEFMCSECGDVYCWECGLLRCGKKGPSLSEGRCMKGSSILEQQSIDDDYSVSTTDTSQPLANFGVSEPSISGIYTPFTSGLEHPIFVIPEGIGPCPKKVFSNAYVQGPSQCPPSCYAANSFGAPDNVPVPQTAPPILAISTQKGLRTYLAINSAKDVTLQNTNSVQDWVSKQQEYKFSETPPADLWRESTISSPPRSSSHSPTLSSEMLGSETESGPRSVSPTADDMIP
jgi:hypothetical protein